jgi:peptidoglycan/xylan/chitin deacetylase (PgdA/CDA1 family)
MMLMKSAAQWLSPAGASARLSVLIFHRVLPQQDPLFPDEMHARRFDELCGWLKQWFNVLPLDAAVRHLKAGSLPPRAACITFDDGYADNHHVAMPILRSHGLTGTFFIATGFLDGGRMWNDTIIECVRAGRGTEFDLSALGLGRHPLGSVDDRKAAIAALVNQVKYRAPGERITLTNQMAVLVRAPLPDNLMMTSQEVKAMRLAGMQIGAHTITHPILGGLGDAQARDEVHGSKHFLEQLLGERVGLFAYPNGKPQEDYTLQSVAVVRGLDFDAAVSTAWGTTGAGDDLFQIRRFTPWDSSRFRFGLRLLDNLRRA